MLQLSAPNNNSRAQVHYHGNVPHKIHYGGGNGGSMQIAMKHHTSNYVKNMPSGYTGADSQLMMNQETTYQRDHETVLHDSPPANTKIFSSSNGGGSNVNTTNQRQIKKSLQHHH